MQRCIELAKNGLGTTYPNPMVGCVIVHNDRIIGEGWHVKAGEPHAEVNALNSVNDRSILKDATLYVSLEPCNHFGKTPPCSNLILEAGLKNIVVGSTDPNPKVAGSGIQKLRDAGCNVTSDILEAECDELNKRFFTYHKLKRPYILLKWAQTSNNYIAPLPINRASEKKPVWITNRFSRQLVHKIRTEEQAILVGTNTVLSDDPSLTSRDWQGRNPIRIIIDRSLKIPSDASIFDGAAKTIVITEKESNNRENISYETLDFTKDLPSQIVALLYKNNIQSLIVEGGAQTLQSFIDMNLWDEALVFTGELEFTAGINAPVLTTELFSEKDINEDVLRHYKNVMS